MDKSSTHLHSSTATKNDPTYPSQSQAKHLYQIPRERSTQQVFGPRNDLPSTDQNVSCPLANLAKPGKFNAMQIVMSVLTIAITYLLADVYTDNHVHRQLAFLNRYRVKTTEMNTTTNIAIHHIVALNDVTMDQNVMNDEILASTAASILKFNSLTESSTEQKLTNFDWAKCLEAETAAVDGERKQSTEVAGAEVVSSDLYLVF